MSADLVSLKDRGVSVGAHLRAEFHRLGLDQIEVAAKIGVSRQTINNIINERQPISRAMAVKLGELTGRSSDYWLRSRFPGGDFAREPVGTSNPTAAQSSEEAPAFGLALLVNRQIIRAVENGTINIDPFVAENVQRATIDLTLDDFVITTAGERTDISDGQTFELKCGHTVNASTKESIELPLDHVGRVGPMARLAKFGMVVSHGIQVDPGYKGQLQFCIFNAGGSPFQLQSGLPIISLEILRLATIPSNDGRGASQPPSPGARDEVAKRFQESSIHRACDELIHDFLRSRVAIDTAKGRIAARISRLDLEVIDSTVEMATEGIVQVSLNSLRSLCKAPDAPTDQAQKYKDFFEDVADELCLSAAHVRAALATMRLSSQADPNYVTLRNGGTTVLQIPQGSSKITLKNLARQLHEDARDLILILTNLDA